MRQNNVRCVTRFVDTPDNSHVVTETTTGSLGTEVRAANSVKPHYRYRGIIFGTQCCYICGTTYFVLFSSGIATRYELEGLGGRIPKGRDFLHFF
jgi:hypothetical protein